MERLYPNEIEFHNDNPPYLDEQNLNSMSHAIAGIDQRVIDTMGDVVQTGVFARRYAEEALQIRSENQAMAAQVYAARSSAEQAMHRAEASDSHAYSYMTQARAAATEAQNAAENAAENAATEAAAKAATKAAEDVRVELDDIKSGAELAAENAAASEADAAESARLARETAENIGAVIHPKGSVLFENLPAVETMDVGDMYNILDDFTTTDDFIIGAGKFYVLGTNVYKTQGGLLDVFAGAPVTGIKGNAEEEYRQGNVNITAANIGALEDVNPKGIGSFSVGYNTLAYYEGSHAEGGYASGMSSENGTVTVTSVDIENNNMELGIHLTTSMRLTAIFTRCLSKTYKRDLVFNIIWAETERHDDYDVDIVGSDFIVTCPLITEEQKTEASQIKVGDTLYFLYGGTVARGTNSHAEGSSTQAHDPNSHAEGWGTFAFLSGAHSEGRFSVASGSNSHAQNLYTIAKGDNQTTIGKYNEIDENMAFIVGNGDSDTNRSNAMTMDWDGNVNLAGTVDAQGFTVNGEPIKGGGSGERVDLPIYRVTLNPTTTAATTYALTIDDFKVPCLLSVDISDDATVQYAYTSSSTPFKINGQDCSIAFPTSSSTSAGTTQSIYIYRRDVGESYRSQQLFLIDAGTSTKPYRAIYMTPYFVNSNTYPSNYVYNDTTSTNSTIALNGSKAFQTSKTDLTAGSSTLTSGMFYVVYE